MSFERFFHRDHHAEPEHTWDVCSHNGPHGSLALEVAREAVRLRCTGVPGLYDSWESQRDGTGHSLALAEVMLPAFLRASFGAPGSPPPDDHLQGAVGEMLWYLLVRDFVHEADVVYAAEPSVSPLDHGGDGFVVHRRPDGSLMFRLWEVKKSTGGSVSATVTRAYAQLDVRAPEYLARLIPPEQRHPDPEVRALVSRSILAWVKGDDEASAGVAVASSTADVPQRCFSTMPGRFDRMRTPNRLRGLLAGVGDLATFADQVRDEVWSGL